MPEPIYTAIIPEKAILIGLITPKQDEERVKEYLDELSFLIDTAGAIPGKDLFRGFNTPIQKHLSAAVN